MRPHHPSRRRSAAVTVFSSRQAIVMGPTPPGTGVIAPASTDPQPQLTLAGTLTDFGLPALQFVDALKLVVLAEWIGSGGFYLSRWINFKGPQTPVQRRRPVSGQPRGRPRTPTTLL